jgi:hypothetical protein
MSTAFAITGRVIAATVHLLGAIGLSAGLISECELMGKLRSLAASDMPRAFRDLLQLRWITALSYVALLVSGGYLALRMHRIDVPWLTASAAGFLILATADFMTARSIAELTETSNREGIAPDAVVAAVHSRSLHISRWVRGLVLTGVILLTRMKPGPVGAFAIIVSALLSGVLAGGASFGMPSPPRRIRQ